jgi:GNAT superfamily N-acetyltransferase
MGTATGVRIRLAAAEDGQRVFPLAREMATSFAVEEASFTVSFAGVLESDDAVVLVAEDRDEIVGYLLGFDHLAFYANGRVAYVEEVAVADERQGQRIGHRLMEAFEEWARARAAVLVTVATRRAGAFYLSVGYEETAVLYRKVL